MSGWMCLVQGKLTPTDFFFGLTLCFDGPPHLAELKRAIEESVVGNNLLAGGSDYIVGDVEILDFRLNTWINLESRGQLYSGCHLAAIRDTASGTCAGPFEAPKKGLDAKVLGFAVDAQRMFEAMDADCEGVLRLKSVLRSLRHDVNYAVDVFTRFDVRATGTVTYQDFVAVYQSATKSFLSELRERLQHGGRSLADAAGAGSSSTKDRDPLRGAGSSEGENRAGAGSPLAAITHNLLSGGFDQAAGSSGLPVSSAPKDSKSPRTSLLQLAAVKGKLKESSGLVSGGSGLMQPHDDEGPEGSEAGAQSVPSNVGAAKSVVDLLQKSITKRREQQTGSSPLGGAAGAAGSSTPTLTQSVVSKLKGLRKPGQGPTTAQSGASSAGSAAGSPTARRRSLV
jgi:hypothetical protein